MQTLRQKLDALDAIVKNTIYVHIAEHAQKIFHKK